MPLVRAIYRHENQSMDIQLNGEHKTIDNGLTAEQLVMHLGLSGKRLAMEINLEIVPRSTYGSVVLKADDKVEIIAAIGGG